MNALGAGYNFTPSPGGWMRFAYPPYGRSWAS